MLRTSETTLTAPNLVRMADGVDLFCRDWGKGRPLLFLSSWALNSLMWGIPDGTARPGGIPLHRL